MSAITITVKQTTTALDSTSTSTTATIDVPLAAATATATAFGGRGVTTAANAGRLSSAHVEPQNTKGEGVMAADVPPATPNSAPCPGGLLPDDVLDSIPPVDPAHNVPEDDVPHDALAGDTSWPLLWQATFAVRQVLSRKFKETPGTSDWTLPALTVAPRPEQMSLDAVLPLVPASKKELDDLMLKMAAHFNLPVLEGEGAAWSAGWPACVLVMEPKELSRAKAKDGGKAPRDLVRASVLAQNMHELTAAISILGWHFQIVTIRNKCETPTATGFRFVLVQAILPGTKMLVEVQFVVASVKKLAKELRIHERFYSKLRMGGDEMVEAAKCAFERYENPA